MQLSRHCKSKDGGTACKLRFAGGACTGQSIRLTEMTAEPGVLERLGGRHPLGGVPHEQALEEVQALGAAGQPGPIVQGDVVHDDCLHDLLQGARAALGNAGPAAQHLAAQSTIPQMAMAICSSRHLRS